MGGKRGGQVKSTWSGRSFSAALVLLLAVNGLNVANSYVNRNMISAIERLRHEASL